MQTILLALLQTLTYRGWWKRGGCVGAFTVRMNQFLKPNITPSAQPRRMLVRQKMKLCKHKSMSIIL